MCAFGTTTAYTLYILVVRKYDINRDRVIELAQQDDPLAPGGVGDSSDMK